MARKPAAVRKSRPKSKLRWVMTAGGVEQGRFYTIEAAKAEADAAHHPAGVEIQSLAAPVTIWRKVRNDDTPSRWAWVSEVRGA